MQQHKFWPTTYHLVYLIKDLLLHLTPTFQPGLSIRLPAFHTLSHNLAQTSACIYSLCFVVPHHCMMSPHQGHFPNSSRRSGI